MVLQSKTLVLRPHRRFVRTRSVHRISDNRDSGKLIRASNEIVENVVATVFSLTLSPAPSHVLDVCQVKKAALCLSGLSFCSLLSWLDPPMVKAPSAFHSNYAMLFYGAWFRLYIIRDGVWYHRWLMPQGFHSHLQLEQQIHQTSNQLWRPQRITRNMIKRSRR